MLDTHVAIWAVHDPDLLSRRVTQLLLEPANEVYVSVVSLWEIAVKAAIPRRNPFPFALSEAAARFEEAGFLWLAASPPNALALESLPLLHADPFDRLLVAQALSEPMRLVTNDRQVAAYSDTIISW